jgi:uncharacterized protein (TIGR00369 family)
MSHPVHPTNPPPGYEQMPNFGPFHEYLGPTWYMHRDGCMTVGLRVEEKHRNRGAMMHGGMICTLADIASHWAARHARQPDHLMLTTGLNVCLMGNAGPGEWVEARVQVLRSGRSIVFTDCHISCDGRAIAQASAQFQVTSEPIPKNP